MEPFVNSEDEPDPLPDPGRPDVRPDAGPFMIGYAQPDYVDNTGERLTADLD